MRSNIRWSSLVLSDRYHTYLRARNTIRSLSSSSLWHFSYCSWLFILRRSIDYWKLFFLDWHSFCHDVRRTNESIGRDHQNMVEGWCHVFIFVETLHTFAVSNLSSGHTYETKESAWTSLSHGQEIPPPSFHSIERQCNDPPVRRLPA